MTDTLRRNGFAFNAYDYVILWRADWTTKVAFYYRDQTHSNVYRIVQIADFQACGVCDGDGFEFCSYTGVDEIIERSETLGETEARRTKTAPNEYYEKRAAVPRRHFERRKRLLRAYPSRPVEKLSEQARYPREGS